MEVHKYKVNHHAMLKKLDNLRFPCDIPNEADKGNNNKTHPENGTSVYNVLKMTNKRGLKMLLITVLL